MLLNRIKNIMINEKVEKIFTFLSVFLIVIYTNIMCLSDYIYKNSVVIAGTFIISIVIALAYTIIREKKIVLKKYEISFIILFIFILFNNYDINRGEYNYIIKFILFATFIVLIKHLDWEKPLLKTLIGIGIAHVIISFILYFNKDFYINNVIPLFNLDKFFFQRLINQVNEGCLLGIASHHSTAGMYFSLAYLASVSCTFKGEKINKKYGILSIIFFICILLTQKRGPLMFAIVASLGYLYVIYSNKSKILIKLRSIFSKSKIKLVIVVLILLIIMVLCLENNTMYNYLNKLSSNRIRDLFMPAIVLFLKNPLFGIGWGAYKYKYLMYSEGFYLTKNNAHCIYLQLLAETGIVGFLIITCIILKTLKNTYEILANIRDGRYKVDEYVKASMIYSFVVQIFFILYGFTGNPLYDYTVFLPYMISLGLCYSFMYKEQKYIIKPYKTKRNKIAIISAGKMPVPPVKGGAVETGIDQIIKENDKTSKIDLTIYSIYDKEAEEIAKSHKARFVYIKETKLEEAFNKIIFVVNAVFRKMKIKFSITSDIPYITKVKKDVKFHDYDAILITNRPDFVLPISEVNNHVIIQLHNDYLNKNTFNAKKIISKSWKISTVSNYIQGRVLEIDENAKQKTVINLNCTDIDIFEKKVTENRKKELFEKYKIGKDDKVIIFNGRLNKEKGIREVLLALKEVPKDLKYKLLIVGTPWYATGKTNAFVKELKEISKDNLEKIEFTGYIPYENLWEIYGISDLAVAPSMWEEPAGRILIEAEAAGVPLIITNSGGMSDYVCEESAVVVKRDQELIKNLAKQIVGLLQDDKKRSKMREEGKEFVSKLNTERYYRDFIKLTKGG